MRSLNPNVLVTAVTDPLTWENAMDIGRGNNCVVYIRYHPRTQYLINRETKTLAMTNGVRGRGRRGGQILLVSGIAMGTEGKITVCNHWGLGVILIPIDGNYQVITLLSLW